MWVDLDRCPAYNPTSGFFAAAVRYVAYETSKSLVSRRQITISAKRRRQRVRTDSDARPSWERCELLSHSLRRDSVNGWCCDANKLATVASRRMLQRSFHNLSTLTISRLLLPAATMSCQNLITASEPDWTLPAVTFAEYSQHRPRRFLQECATRLRQTCPMGPFSVSNQIYHNHNPSPNT